ncbi:uncharacterized protein [Ambystoma mexicanum]|uniref:uncharacterized protein isoform X3 n=1 Tax=Ambystoma mexicanum TaxID=8296 RepID=UPI0037E757A9
MDSGVSHTHLICFLICGTILTNGKNQVQGAGGVRLVTTSHPVELPCKVPSDGSLLELKWRFESADVSVQRHNRDHEGKTLLWMMSNRQGQPRCTGPSLGFEVPACSSTQRNYSLLFTPTRENAGNYYCKWEFNDSDRELFYLVRLLAVNLSYASNPRPPPAGENVTLHCGVYPLTGGIKFSWFLGNKPLKNITNKRIISHDGRNLTLLNVKRSEDSGTYVCKACVSHKQQCATADYTLNVAESTAFPERTTRTSFMTGRTSGVPGSNSSQSTPTGLTSAFTHRTSNQSTTPGLTSAFTHSTSNHSTTPGITSSFPATSSPQSTSTELLLVYTLVPLVLVILALVLLWWFFVGSPHPESDATILVEKMAGENEIPAAGPQEPKNDGGVIYATINAKGMPPAHRVTPSAAATSEYATVRV